MKKAVNRSSLKEKKGSEYGMYLQGKIRHKTYDARLKILGITNWRHQFFIENSNNTSMLYG